jgi:hypothetical protein
MASGRDIGGEFAAALRAADFAAIGRCLSPAVQLRALLPSGMVDAVGRAAAVAMLADWLNAGAGYTVLAASSDVPGCLPACADPGCRLCRHSVVPPP